MQMGKICNGHSETGIKKYRLTFSKTGFARYLSHLELMRVFIRALRRADLNLVFSNGYHPMPKASFTCALPVGTESVHETVDIEMYEIKPVLKLKEEINRQLPDGVMISLLEDVSLEDHRPRLIESHFRMTLNGLEIDRHCIDRFLNSDYFPIVKKTKKGDQEVNARSLVKSLDFKPPGQLDLVIKHIPGPEVKPIYIIKEIFRFRDSHLIDINVLKTRQIME